MLATIKLINDLDAKKLLCFGVGIAHLFYDQLRAQYLKIGVEPWDGQRYPKQWTHRIVREDILETAPEEGKYDVIVLIVTGKQVCYPYSEA